MSNAYEETKQKKKTYAEDLKFQQMSNPTENNIEKRPKKFKGVKQSLEMQLDTELSTFMNEPCILRVKRRRDED